jgi:hypothetical protein
MEPIRSYAGTRGGRRRSGLAELPSCFHKEKTRGLGGNRGSEGRIFRGEAEGGFCDAPTTKLQAATSGSKPSGEYFSADRERCRGGAVIRRQLKRCFSGRVARLVGSLRQKLIEDPHDERVVTLVIEALQALVETWVMREHVIFKCKLNPISQHPLPGRDLMYGATDRTDRAEPVGFVISRIDRAAIGSSS